MEPTFFEVLFQCIAMPSIAICLILGFLFTLLFGGTALLDILEGKDPSKETLAVYFQEGAIFGPRRK